MSACPMFKFVPQKTDTTDYIDPYVLHVGFRKKKKPNSWGGIQSKQPDMRTVLALE